METIKELKEICQPHRKKGKYPNDWGYLKHRELSIYITKAILKLADSRIKPNHISVFNILFGLVVLSLVVLIQDKLFLLLLLFLFYFSFLLDKVDGEVARYQKFMTLRGSYLDEIYHLFVQNGLILAVGINRFLATGEKAFFLFGIAGFFLFFIARYLRKIRYFICAKYKSEKDAVSIKKDLSWAEKILVNFLNIAPLKLCSVARRQDVFLFLVFVLAVFYFNSTAVWFWFLLGWSVMLLVNVLRFLFLNYFHIDRDVQLVDENKL